MTATENLQIQQASGTGAANGGPSVQRLLLTVTDNLAEPSRSACQRIIGGGGKRLRPELVLRTALDGGAQCRSSEFTRAVRAATAIELLHTATLVHDDFLDHSASRRGVATVNAAEGAAAAIIAGDALIAQSFRLMAGVGSEAVEDLADALADMCSGQSLEDTLKFNSAADAFEVLLVSRLKTGALIKAACRVGARLGGMDQPDIQSLGAFGSDLGTALQLIDDTLDLLSDEVTFGKPCGADFAVGTVTLPTVFALNPVRDDSQQWNRDVGELSSSLAGLLRPGLTEAECASAKELLVSSEGPFRTISLARTFAQRASTAVPVISEGYRNLAALPGQYVEDQLRSKVSPQFRWILDQNAHSTTNVDVHNADYVRSLLETLDRTG